MSCAGGPDLIQDGLVLHLDAADRKSYPGSGTIWTDRSGFGNNGTLTNGPTFSAANGGFIALDGSNDYIEIATRNTMLEFQPLQKYSVFCWLYNLASNLGAGAIIANMIEAGTYSGWDLWINNSTQIAAHLITNWSTNAVKVAITFDYAGSANKWTHIGYTYNGTSPANATDALNSIDFYVNGFLSNAGKTNNIADGFNTTSETTTYNSSQRLRIGSRWVAGASSSQNRINIANVSIYNKALSPSEILQNYNSQKSRFNLR